MNNPDPFIQKIKQTLDRQELDKDISQRLSRARYQALEQQPRSSLFSRYAGPVVAFASIGMLAIALTLSNLKPKNANPMDSIEAFEIITSNEPLEMYQNLEFYLWLDEELKT